MSKSGSSLTLRQLLDHCSDPSNPHYRQRWDKFYNRYNDFIYGHIRQNCVKWNSKRLDLQLAEVTDDIVSEVYDILRKKLETFIFRDDKIKFLAWLKVICRRTSVRFLTKYFPSTYDADIENIILHVDGMHTECVWEYYELVVKISRVATQRKSLERDLIIFQLVVFGQLSKRAIRGHHCFSRLTDQNIFVAINRVRDKLRDNRDLF